MNSFQYLEKEVDDALAIDALDKLDDILRRIKNLMKSPTCGHYPWDTLVTKALSRKRKEDADVAIAGILKLREQETERKAIQETVKENFNEPMEDTPFEPSEEFLNKWANAFRPKKKEYYHYD